MGERSEDKKSNPWPDAVIGGMFGVAVGWFYKREATQSMIKQVKQSELARNIATDVYQSTQKHLRDYVTDTFESKANHLFQTDDPDTSAKENDSAENAEDEKDETSNEDQSYEDLKKENEQLDEMISYLEKKFEDLR